MTFAYRAALFAIAGVFLCGMATAPSLAALDMFIGARQIVKDQPISDCNAKARRALNAVLQDAEEIGSGDTGEWKATGVPDASGHASSAAAVHCYPLGADYLVTFTCAVQVQPNADTASSLCAKLTAAFGTKAAASILTVRAR